MRINNFRGDLTDISAKKEALISNFNTHFLNPLASSAASGWMQCESSVKLEKLYALNVGKRLRDKYIRYIHRRGPSKLQHQSSLQVHYKFDVSSQMHVRMLSLQRPCLLVLRCVDFCKAIQDPRHLFKAKRPESQMV